MRYAMCARIRFRSQAVISSPHGRDQRPSGRAGPPISAVFSIGASASLRSLSHPTRSGPIGLREAVDEFLPAVAEVAETFGQPSKLLASFATREFRPTADNKFRRKRSLR